MFYLCSLTNTLHTLHSYMYLKLTVFHVLQKKIHCSTVVVIYRCDAAQRVNDVLVCVKKKLQQSPECMSAIAKIVVQLLLWTDDSNKTTKPLIQVHCPMSRYHHCYHILTIMLKLNFLTSYMHSITYWDPTGLHYFGIKRCELGWGWCLLYEEMYNMAACLVEVQRCVG